LEYAKHRCGVTTSMCRDYFREPNRLYEHALNVQKLHGFEFPLTMSSLNYLVETYASNYVLCVYDSSCGCPFWLYKGSTYESSEEIGYRRGELTKTVWEETFNARICLYLDVGHRHYIPIFDLPLFFGKSYRPSKLVVEEEAWRARQSRLGRPCKVPKRFHVENGYISGKPRYPCPACHVMSFESDLEKHACLCRICQMCDRFFADMDAFHRHQQSVDGTVFECERCFSKMKTPECFTQHKLMACNAYPKEECQRCLKKIDPNEMHVCKPRKCHRCKEPFLETYQFDEDGKGYFVAHKCTLKQKPNPNRRTYVADVHEYAFDMESMLVPSRYGYVNVYEKISKQYLHRIYMK